jgi:hypothetical protein
VPTGSRPDFDDRSHFRVVNSDQLLTLNALPPHLAIIGASCYIGCEFASISTGGWAQRLPSSNDRVACCRAGNRRQATTWLSPSRCGALGSC